MVTVKMFEELVKIDLYLFEKEAIERLSVAFNLYKYWIPIDVKGDIKVLVELVKESKSQIEILTTRIKMLEDSQLVGKVNAVKDFKDVDENNVENLIEDVLEIICDLNELNKDIKEPTDIQEIIDDVNELVDDVKEVVEDVQELIENAIEDVVDEPVDEPVDKPVGEPLTAGLKKRWSIKKCFFL
jgi:methyl-accepting chemotaxis protein